MLPGVHGDELLPMIRQLLGDHVAVVAVSALGELSLVQRCIFRGADSFMVAAADPAVQPYATQAATQAATSCMQGCTLMFMYARQQPYASQVKPLQIQSVAQLWQQCMARRRRARTPEPAALGRTLPTPTPVSSLSTGEESSVPPVVGPAVGPAVPCHERGQHAVLHSRGQLRAYGR